MATPILTQISKDLSYKLQDPVSSGTASGARLTADERLRYIIRAYRRLLRTVTLLYPTLTYKIFQGYYEPVEGNSNAQGEIIGINAAEYVSVHCKRSTDTDYVKATPISLEDYYSILDGENVFYKGDAESGIYFWVTKGATTTPIIYLLPKQTLSYRVIYRPNILAAIETSGYSSAVDIDIMSDYVDLLISFAAAEAYMDIGQVDMYNLFNNDATQQLNVLVAKTEKEEQKDEKEDI